MDDWLKTLDKAIENDSQRFESIEQNRRNAHEGLMKEAIPALEQLRAELAVRNRTMVIATDVDDDENPRVSVVISGAPHDPVHIAIVTVATPSTISAAIVVGQGHPAISHPFPGGYYQLDRQTVLETVASLYVQTIRERLASNDKRSGPSQGTAAR